MQTLQSLIQILNMKMGWKLAGFMLLKAKSDCWIWFWQLVGRNRLDLSLSCIKCIWSGIWKHFLLVTHFIKSI